MVNLGQGLQITDHIENSVIGIGIGIGPRYYRGIGIDQKTEKRHLDPIRIVELVDFPGK